jgi:hypothetical protein
MGQGGLTLRAAPAVNGKHAQHVAHHAAETMAPIRDGHGVAYLLLYQ